MTFRVSDLPQLAVDHRRLTDAIEDVLGTGGRVPCIGDQRWTSADSGEQREAARLCAGCPVILDCATYYARWSEPAGVWAGRTERDRDRRTGKRVVS